MSATLEASAMIDDAFATVGARLRSVREILVLSPAAMAAALGVTTERIADVEAGAAAPPAQMLIRMAALWPQISPDWLLAGRGPMLRREPAEASGGASWPGGGPSAADADAQAKADAVRDGIHRVGLLLRGVDIIIADKIGIGNQGTSPDDMEVIWELVSVARAAAREAHNAVT